MRSWVRASRVVVAVVAAVLLLPGCSVGNHPYVDVRTPQPPAERADRRCPRDGAGLGVSGMQLGPGPLPGVLPASFRPTQARLCQATDDAAPKVKGKQGYVVAELTAPVDARLVSALALPDQKFDVRDNGACAASYTPPVYFLLIGDDGEAYRPHLPAGPCGAPRREMQEALNALPFAKRTTYTVYEKAG